MFGRKSLLYTQSSCRSLVEVVNEVLVLVAVKIASARRQQAVLFHKCDKVLFVLFVVRGIVEFHSVESELFETAEQHIEAFVEQVFFRVSDGSETAVFFYEFHRLDGRKSFCLAIRFRPGFKVSVESVVDISAISFFSVSL